MLNQRTHQLYKPYLKPLARQLRKNATTAEILLWEKLKNRQLLNYKFRRQTAVDKYIVDFYCKELKLVIEIDGFSHDFKMEYDEVRQKRLESFGLTILRFSDIEVKKDIQSVLQRIAEWIDGHATGLTHPYPAQAGN